jgi:hypothetical protein
MVLAKECHVCHGTTPMQDISRAPARLVEVSTSSRKFSHESRRDHTCMRSYLVALAGAGGGGHAGI